MSVVINTNLASLNAQKSLSASSNSMATSVERLSSGKRVNSAKDDAAGLAIAERMNTQIRGMNVAIRNANDGISLVQTAEGALASIAGNLQRIRELAVQSANAVNSTDDHAALDAEAQHLLAEITRIASTSTFNGSKLLDGSFAASTIQVGANSGDTISIGAMGNFSKTDIVPVISVPPVPPSLKSIIFGGIIGATNYKALTLKDSAAVPAVLAVAAALGPPVVVGVVASPAFLAANAQANSISALAQVDEALNKVNSERANLGALNNTFESAIGNLQNSVENHTASRSRIIDADFALETANMSRAQVLQQAGMAMVAQANQSPQQVMTLLRQ